MRCHHVDGDVNPQEQRRGHRRPTIVVVMLIVIATALGGGLFARHQADKGRMAVGDSRRGDYSVSGGGFYQSFSFIVPGAQLSVTAQVGPRASMLNAATDDFVRVKAPRGGLLVQLEWDVSATQPHGMLGSSRQASTLAVRSSSGSVVVASGIRAPAGTSSSSGDDDSRRRLVAVSGDLGDLQLTVAFQGHTQSVSLLTGRRQLGAFASFYRPPQATAGWVSIGRTQPTDPASKFRWFCTPEVTGLTRAPYLEGLGWAKAGQEWAVVTGVGLRTTFRAATWSDGERYAEYAADGTPRVALTLNGRHAQRTLKSTPQRPSELVPTRDYVFSIRSGEEATIRVAATIPVTRAAGEDLHAPARTTVRVNQTMTVPAVIDPAPRNRR